MLLRTALRTHFLCIRCLNEKLLILAWSAPRLKPLVSLSRIDLQAGTDLQYSVVLFRGSYPNMPQYGVEHNRSIKIRLSIVLTSDTKPLVTTRICLTSLSIKSRIETHYRTLRRPCPKNQNKC